MQYSGQFINLLKATFDDPALIDYANKGVRSLANKLDKRKLNVPYDLIFNTLKELPNALDILKAVFLEEKKKIEIYEMAKEELRSDPKKNAFSEELLSQIEENFGKDSYYFELAQEYGHKLTIALSLEILHGQHSMWPVDKLIEACEMVPTDRAKKALIHLATKAQKQEEVARLCREEHDKAFVPDKEYF